MNRPQETLLAHITNNKSANVKTAYRVMKQFGDGAFWDAIRALVKSGQIKYDSAPGTLRLA